MSSIELQYNTPHFDFKPFSGTRHVTGFPQLKSFYGQWNEETARNLERDTGLSYTALVRYQLLRSQAENCTYVALINGQHYSLHHNRDGFFLFQLVPDEHRCVAVEVHDGAEYDGHRIEFQIVPWN
jgi:hypothetical protein